MSKNKHGLKFGISARYKALDKQGTSRHKLKQENIRSGKGSYVEEITGTKTLRGYQAISMAFADYMYERDIKIFEKITEEHCIEWLNYKVEQDRLKYTSISRYKAALNKTFNFDIEMREINVKKEESVFRSNNDTNLKISQEKYREFQDEIFVSKATGMRDRGISTVKYSYFHVDEEGLCDKVRIKEKGGKTRVLNVLQGYQYELGQMLLEPKYLERKHDEQPLFGWNYAKSKFDNHTWRREYAARRYEEEEIKTGNTTKTYKGELNKECVLAVSKDLGHNREYVIDSYSKYMGTDFSCII